MRVFFAAARPCYPLFLGGAEISMHETLLAFARHGHVCRALGQTTHGLDDLSVALQSHSHEVRSRLFAVPGGTTPLPQQCEAELDVGYQAVLSLHADFAACLRRQIDAFRPDVVCSQLEGSELVVREAQRRGIPVVHTVRDLDNPHNFLPFLSHRTSGGEIQTLTTSRFAQERLRARHGIESEVVPPAIDLDRFRPAAEPHGAVVMVNPAPSKGGDIVRGLIEKLSDVPFVLVEGWSELHTSDWPYENVRLERRRPDIHGLIAGAAALLAPSQAEEAFGRVVVEAQAAGVPVLASRHSGLIEACGEGGGLVEDFRNGNAWLSNLRELLHNPERRENLRRHGLTHARRFGREQHWENLKAVWPRCMDH